MQLRKVQEMGGATLLVSLPKEWVRSTTLKKGGIVSIENSGDGGLLIYASGESSHKEKEIEIQYPSKFGTAGLSNEITGAYLLGYDLIHVRGAYTITSKDREEIISSIKGLIGLEVVEENAQNITCQFLVDNTAVEPSKIFRRISSIVLAMIADSVKQLSSEEPVIFEPVSQRDDEVDRLHFLLVRVIRTAVRDPRTASKFGLSAIDCLDYRVAASLCETAGDYAVELSNAIAELGIVDKKVRDELVAINETLDLILDGAVKSFIGKEYASARGVLSNCKDLDSALSDFRTKNEKQGNFAGLLHLADIFERIAHCERDIADLVAPMRPA